MGTGASAANRPTASRNQINAVADPLLNTPHPKIPRRRPSSQEKTGKRKEVRYKNHNNALFPVTTVAPQHNAVAAGANADGMPAGNKEISSSLSSISSNPSATSVTEELDNLKTELDQVLIGHYYAVTKPPSGVLRTGEIAVLERHNQLQPLPGDYQPLVGPGTGPTDGPGPSQWVRPEDLARQEKQLREKIRMEQEVQHQQQEKDGDERRKDKKGKSKKAKTSQRVIQDVEDEQDRGDFDVIKYKAVNVPKEEPSTGGLDIYSSATYKNYSSKVQAANNDKESKQTPESSAAAGRDTPGTSITYQISEEALLQSIEDEFV